MRGRVVGGKVGASVGAGRGVVSGSRRGSGLGPRWRIGRVSVVGIELVMESEGCSGA